MSDEIQIINEGAETVVAVTLLTKPDEGGSFDATALAEVMHAATAKSTPEDNDAVAIVDSAASNGLKKTLWSAIKATLKTYFDGIYTNASATATQIANAITALGLGDAATKDVGTANGVASLGSDGKIPSTQLPAIAIVDYLGTAANEAAMLALTGQKGDWAQRTDLGTMWFIIGDDPTDLASWREMTYPTAPVSSVAGLTGSIASGDLRTAMGLATTSDVTFETLFASEYGDYATPSIGFAGTCGFLRNDNDVLYKNSNIAFLLFQHPGGFTMTDYYGSAPIRWGGLGNNGVVASYSLGVEKESAGVLAVTSGTSGQYREIKARGRFHSPVAIASLPPAASSAGWRYEVNDANAPSVGATVASGGAAACEVRSNGTDWIVTQVF